MSATRLTRHIRAPRAVVYRALLDPEAVQHWMVPDGMTSRVHVFEPRGRQFRIHGRGLGDHMTISQRAIRPSESA